MNPPYIEELMSLGALLTGILQLREMWKSRPDRSSEIVLARIRQLYFEEKGTLGFLRGVANGRTVPKSIRTHVRSRFYEQEEGVSEAVASLRQSCERNNVRLSIRDRELLSGIITDKTVIRDLVRNLLDKAENRTLAEADRAQAKELCDGIEALNSRLRQADAQLRG